MWQWGSRKLSEGEWLRIPWLTSEKFEEELSWKTRVVATFMKTAYSSIPAFWPYRTVPDFHCRRRQNPVWRNSIHQRQRSQLAGRLPGSTGVQPFWFMAASAAAQNGAGTEKHFVFGGVTGETRKVVIWQAHCCSMQMQNADHHHHDHETGGEHDHHCGGHQVTKQQFTFEIYKESKLPFQIWSFGSFFVWFENNSFLTYL